MREFIILCHEVPIDGPISLEDLPGAGRLDSISRALIATLLTSHGIREDTRTHLVVQNTLTMTFDGATLRGLHPDERSTAARIRSILECREELVGAQPIEPSSGIALRRGGLDDLPGRLRTAPVVLHEDGDPISDRRMDGDLAVVLSDHRSFASDELQALEGMSDGRYRLGPRALHTDQAVTVVHHYLDTDGYRAF